MNCTEEFDYEFDRHVNCSALEGGCTPEDCPAQGPLRLPFVLYHWPEFVFVTTINLPYYTGQVFLYREPLGLIFLVLASLSSSFLIPPFMKLFGMTTTFSSWITYVLGIVGALLCAAELPVAFLERFSCWCWRRFVTSRFEASNLRQQLEEEPKEGEEANGIELPNSEKEPVEPAETQSASEIHEDINSTTDEVAKPTIPEQEEISSTTSSNKRNIISRICKKFASFLKPTARIIIPMVLFSTSSAVYFGAQKIFNNKYHLNAFSYFSVDRGLFFFCALPFLFIVSVIPPALRTFDKEEYWKENFLKSSIETFKDLKNPWALFYMNLSRALINFRGFLYFYLVRQRNFFIELTQ